MAGRLPVLILISLILGSTSTWACLGPFSEVAQESEATTLFQGKATGYELLKQEKLGKVSFQVIKHIKGEKKDHWTVLMRGESLPSTIVEFRKKFGTVTRVGIREMETAKVPSELQGLLFVVDSACNMHGDDWLLRPVTVSKVGAK